MDRERWKRIESVYDHVLGYLPGERDAALNEACHGDSELRREVESLLAASDEAGSFLSSSDLRQQIGSLAEDLPAVSIGQKLGRYELLSEIGAGAMGVVYLARDTDLDRRVALKLLPPAFTADPKRSARFVAEAKAASGLNHPNILTIYEIGEAGGISYIATEYVDGTTLRERIKAGALEPVAALDIVLQCTAALAAAHDAGVVHRDIKPENIMLRRDGLVKVVDFGLARITGGETRLPAADVTEPGRVLGTPRYMSPEQARGESLDARSDIFSLAAVLYELVAGRPAAPGKTTAEIFAALLGPDFPPALPTPGDPELQHVLNRALHQDRTERYPAMDAFADDLKALRTRLSAGRKPSRGPVRWHALRRHGWKVAAATVAAAAVMALNAGGLRDRIARLAGAPRVASLVVLPLPNTSNDAEQDYFVDGITDQLIGSLARATSLRVISRGTAMQFKGSSEPPAEIARTLGVEAVVEGSLRRAGGQVQFTAHVMDARNNRQLWSRTYTRADSDLAPLPSEVAADIARELVGRAAPATASSARSVDPKAYELYLRGRHAWNRRTADGYRRALDYFSGAVDADPLFAPAHAGLADTYLLLGEYLIWPPAEAFPRARAAAQTALTLDDSLAQPYATLGQVNSNEWKWSDADRAFQQVVTRDPGYATGRQWRAEYLAVSGRADEALAEIRRARELDPLSLIINAQLGWILVIARQPQEAITQLRRTLEMAPRFAQAYNNLGIAYDQLGQHADAREMFDKATALGGGDEPQFWLARQEAKLGRASRAREMLGRLMPLAEKGHISPSTVALVYLALGEVDASLTWLRRGCEHRSLGPAVYPPFDPIRSDPRFVEIMRCMGVPSL